MLAARSRGIGSRRRERNLPPGDRRAVSHHSGQTSGWNSQPYPMPGTYGSDRRAASSTGFQAGEEDAQSSGTVHRNRPAARSRLGQSWRVDHERDMPSDHQALDYLEDDQELDTPRATRYQDPYDGTAREPSEASRSTGSETPQTAHSQPLPQLRL